MDHENSVERVKAQVLQAVVEQQGHEIALLRTSVGKARSRGLAHSETEGHVK